MLHGDGKSWNDTGAGTTTWQSQGWESEGWDDEEDLKAEADVAKELGTRWQDRGPPRAEHHSATWRNQAYRKGSGRWANRGGQAREWFTHFYSSKGTKGRSAASEYADEMCGKGKGGKGKGGKVAGKGK